MLPQKGLQTQPTYLRGRQSFQPGQNPLGKAGVAAVWDFFFTTRTKRRPCRIHTELTGSVASPILSVINATRVSSVSPSITQVKASLEWGVVG